MSPVLSDDQWPWTVKGTLSLVSLESEGYWPSRNTSSASSATAWPAAGLALFVPFLFPQPVTIGRAIWTNGATLAGNVEVAWWNNPLTSKLWSTGSVAQSGVSTLQQAPAAAATFGPGRFYAMFVCSSTGMFLADGVAYDGLRAAWVLGQTGLTTLPVGSVAPTQVPSTATQLPIVTFTNGQAL